MLDICIKGSRGFCTLHFEPKDAVVLNMRSSIKEFEICTNGVIYRIVWSPSCIDYALVNELTGNDWKACDIISIENDDTS